MLEISEITNKKEAIRAISNFFKKVNKNSYEINEGMRILVDEKGIVSKSECANIAECVKKYSQSSWDKKTVYAHLNVGRMVHEFKKRKVPIPVEVSYTANRTLSNAFNDKDKKEQLALQMQAWKIANSNKEGKFVQKEDIENAVETIKSNFKNPKVVSITKGSNIAGKNLKDDNKGNTNRAANQKEAVKSNVSVITDKVKKCPKDLPEETKEILMENLKTSKNNHIEDKLSWDLFTNLIDMLDDDYSFEEIIERMKEKLKFVEGLLASIDDYEDDCDKLESITDDIYSYGVDVHNGIFPKKVSKR